MRLGALARVFTRPLAVTAMLCASTGIGGLPASAQQVPPPAYPAPPSGQQAYPAPPPGHQAPPPGQQAQEFSPNEIVDAGHRFFGGVSRGLATIVEKAVSQWGLPNGYILGEEGGGAFFGGLRYGEGMLYTKDAGVHRIYWQGPSVGWDAGAEGSKVMVLVYNLRDPEEIYQRFGGVDGSAYLVGGVGVTFLTSSPVIVAPIRSGVGLRLGANIGYLKYTRRPTWNPF
jgi:hypothetical protein